jgi:hypothetical protein
LIFQRKNLQLTKGNFRKVINSELTQALGPVVRRVGSIENVYLAFFDVSQLFLVVFLGYD